MRALDTNYLKIGQKVHLCTTSYRAKATVFKITKTMVMVKTDDEKGKNYHRFRKTDGRDMGPITSNVYFLSD